MNDPFSFHANSIWKLFYGKVNELNTLSIFILILSAHMKTQKPKVFIVRLYIFSKYSIYIYISKSQTDMKKEKVKKNIISSTPSCLIFSRLDILWKSFRVYVYIFCQADWTIDSIMWLAYIRFNNLLSSICFFKVLILFIMYNTEVPEKKEKKIKLKRERQISWENKKSESWKSIKERKVKCNYMLADF